MNSDPAPTADKTFMDMVLKFLGILYFVLLVLTIAYLWVVAQDRFVSIASFKISRQSSSPADGGFAQLMLPGMADTGSADSQLASAFVDSSDLLIDLEKEFQLQEHYSKPGRDIYFRLAKNAPLEKRLAYYRENIFAHFDSETGMTLLTVTSFDRKFSKLLAENLLQRTEDFINKLNQTIATEQLQFVRGELDRAEKNVKDASVAILNLQNANRLISPDEEISGNLLALQELRMKRLNIQTSLASIERDSPESPSIEIMHSQLRSLEEQIAQGLAKLSGPEQDSLNQILARYKELELQLEFAVKYRTGAVALLEKNRMDAMSRSRFISIIQRPYLPEDVAYPQRSYSSITIGVLGLLLFMILRVLVRSLLERSEFN